MAFLGNVFSKIGGAISSFAKSGIGQMLIKAGIGVVAGPFAPLITGVATKLLSGQKLTLGGLLKDGLNAFAPIAGKLAGSLVSKLPTALQAPLGNIAGSLLKGEKPSLSSIVNSLKNTKLGGTISKVLGQAQKLLGTGTKITGDTQSVSKALSNLLGNFGVNTGGLNKVSDAISKVLGALNGVQGFINKAMGIFNPQTTGMPLMRA